MNNQSPHNILLIGLPSTGKTSFLAALWYAVQQTHVATGLMLKKLDGNSKYLNEIRDAWLAFKPVGRNQLDVETMISMTLKKRQSDAEIKVTFPDISGESFKLLWTSRQLTASYNNCLKNATGGVLFIHSQNIQKALRIDQLTGLVAAAEGQSEPDAQTDQPAAVISPWNAENSPTQVQLIELLQIIMGREHFRPPFKLAVVISAWDLLGDTSKLPANWIADELPMLNQFLLANDDQFDIQFYGISAQGCDYESAGVIATQKKTPARRIEVVGSSVKNKHDITEPIEWLMT